MAFHYTPAQASLHLGTHILEARWATAFQRGEDEGRTFPIGSSVWPGALALLETMHHRPELFSGKRILELGCGVGLGSVFARMLGAQVTATDSHAEMGAFVVENARVNHVEVPFEAWDCATQVMPAGPWDMLFGSDLLYSQAGLTGVINAVQNVVGAGGVSLLTDPGRRAMWVLVEKLKLRGFDVEHSRMDVDASLFPGAGDILAGHPPLTGPCHVLMVRPTALT